MTGRGFRNGFIARTGQVTRGPRTAAAGAGVSGCPGTETFPQPPTAYNGGTGGGPAGALIGRAFRDARVLTVVFTYLFAVYSFVQPVGYRRAYPALPARLAFARGFGAPRGCACFTVSQTTC
jgi:hypothetical protein